MNVNELIKILIERRDLSPEFGDTHIVLRMENGTYAEIDSVKSATIDELFALNAPYDDETHASSAIIINLDR